MATSIALTAILFHRATRGSHPVSPGLRCTPPHTRPASAPLRGRVEERELWRLGLLRDMRSEALRWLSLKTNLPPDELERMVQRGRVDLVVGDGRLASLLRGGQPPLDEVAELCRRLARGGK
jgi:hypothetical protein